MQFTTSLFSKVILCVLVSLVSFQCSPGPGVSLPGFSWGWGTETQNYTKIVTHPSVIQRYPLHYPFRQCSSGMEGVMTELLLYPCIGERGRCHLTRGENVTLDLEFISNIPAESLVGSVSAFYARWFPPKHLQAQDLCTSEHIACPIQPYSPYRYRTSILVAPALPLLSPDIRVIIKTENDRDIACAIVPVSIMDLRDRDTRDVRQTRDTATTFTM